MVDGWIRRIIENDGFFQQGQDWRGRGSGQIFQYVVLKWTLCFLLGLAAGAVGFFINLAVENVAGVKFVVTSNLMLSGQLVPHPLSLATLPCFINQGFNCGGVVLLCAGIPWPLRSLPSSILCFS